MISHIKLKYYLSVLFLLFIVFGYVFNIYIFAEKKISTEKPFLRTVEGDKKDFALTFYNYAGVSYYTQKILYDYAKKNNLSDLSVKHCLRDIHPSKFNFLEKKFNNLFYIHHIRLHRVSDDTCGEYYLNSDMKIFKKDFNRHSFVVSDIYSMHKSENYKRTTINLFLPNKPEGSDFKVVFHLENEIYFVPDGENSHTQ